MVTIMDRTGEQQEVKYDQVVYGFGKKATQVLPLEVASWLFRSQNPLYWVHTTDGQYLRRYGVVDAPEDWLTETGEDVIDTSPLTRDTTRKEGWDAEAVRIGGTKELDLTTTPHRARSGDYEHLGAR